MLEGASELRIMLCRPKEGTGERSSSSIIAACGIYMKVVHVRVYVLSGFLLVEPLGAGLVSHSIPSLPFRAHSLRKVVQHVGIML